jgi:hypothetical protein
MVRLVPESLLALTSEEAHGGAVGTEVEHASVLLEHCAQIAAIGAMRTWASVGVHSVP